jgi:release factor glutamine methyltransferase
VLEKHIDSSSKGVHYSNAAAQLLATATAELGEAGIRDARFDAEILLASACGCSRAEILCGIRSIDEYACERFAAMIRRRKRREPVAYILGHKEFYSLEIEVGPPVLIPRPETESVVAAALELIGNRPESRLCDIGTGSGAVALAIAANAPKVQVTATDISSEALLIAHANAARHGLLSRIDFRLADCWKPRDDRGPIGRFDFIVSNPPYVRDDEIESLDPEISRYEPRLALSGGFDGLEFYRRIAAGLPDYVQNGGFVIVEVGASQATAVRQILIDAGAASVSLKQDLAGLPRVIVASFR